MGRQKQRKTKTKTKNPKTKTKKQKTNHRDNVAFPEEISRIGGSGRHRERGGILIHFHFLLVAAKNELDQSTRCRGNRKEFISRRLPNPRILLLLFPKRELSLSS